MRFGYKALLTDIAAFSAAILLSGCVGASLTAIPAAVPSTLNPQGPIAAGLSNAALSILVGGGLLLVLYTVFILVATLRRRQAPVRDKPGASASSLVIPIAGVVIPAVFLIAALSVTLGTVNATLSEGSDAYIVRVVAHQWWWQVYYPDGQVTTANEIHIPAGRPVQILETSTDVIHSLWIPQLGGKMEAIPGRQTSMLIQASQPGTYRGECAAFCGAQHAHMDLIVIAEPPDQFATWLKAQQAVPPAPTDPHLRQGQQAFLGSACVYCHTIRGTNASGTLGPDLTHLASRQTIGAGMLPNTRGNLAGWIADAQGIKPGNLMPPMQLDGDQLQAVLDYLASLK